MIFLITYLIEFLQNSPEIAVKTLNKIAMIQQEKDAEGLSLNLKRHRFVETFYKVLAYQLLNYSYFLANLDHLERGRF